ncbi:MAG: hypothetical protein KAV87_50420 [Desulfobacteraceae bacterium]|nr:hypothetical protein [Desulfobacteraceae bacterium]
MIVTCTDIVARIKKLPDDYAEHVHMSKPGIAEVTSFSKPMQETPYTVKIERTKNDGERKVVCSCEATKLCIHVTAFYAVAKGIKPDGSVEFTKKDTKPKDETKETTSEEIKGKKIEQKKGSKSRAELYGEIAGAFYLLFERFQKLGELEDK